MVAIRHDFRGHFDYAFGPFRGLVVGFRGHLWGCRGNASAGSGDVGPALALVELQVTPRCGDPHTGGSLRHVRLDGCSNVLGAVVRRRTRPPRHVQVAVDSQGYVVVGYVQTAAHQRLFHLRRPHTVAVARPTLYDFPQ